MSRLLIIFCPVNPRTLNQPTQAGDLDAIDPAENFRWYLHDSEQDSASPSPQGHGGLRDLPFADEALILLPTVDVRLIHTRVPMISDKKLATLLPTLTEPYLLDQRTALIYQVLPPLPGTKGIERTIAVMSESWMAWLMDQLSGLPVRIATMIPDSFLLEEAEADQHRELLLIEHGKFNAISSRDGADWGAGWVETTAENAPSATDHLTQSYPNALLRPFAWPWLAERAVAWPSRKISVNLLQKIPPKKKKQSTSEVATPRWSAKVDWLHWRRPVHLAGVALAIFLAGSAINLGLLALSNWQWQTRIVETARQYLGIRGQDNTAAIRTMMTKTTRSIHAQGGTTPVDFVPMAAKLQVLLGDYPPGLLESLDYNPSGLTFTLRKGIDTPDTATLLSRANHLQLAVIAKGTNTYRMLPLSGLNQDLR